MLEMTKDKSRERPGSITNHSRNGNQTVTNHSKNGKIKSQRSSGAGQDRPLEVSHISF